MFQRLCIFFQDTWVLLFGGGGGWGGVGGGGYVLSGHCNRQQISLKTEWYLFSEGYLFTEVYGIKLRAAAAASSFFFWSRM